MGSVVEDSGDRRLTMRRILERAEAGRRKEDRERHELLGEAVETGSIETRGAGKYMLLLAAIFVIGLSLVKSANTYLAPMLHDPAVIDRAATHLASGQSYHTYDLNIETRRLRHKHIMGLKRRPETAILGASHWQEGHSYLGRGADIYNAHVHRDYYEDMLAVTGMFLRYGKLPKKMIITIRDNLFTPVSARTDFLWVPVLADYRHMARQLGLPAHEAYAYGWTPQVRQNMNLALLKANVERFLASPVKPFVSKQQTHPTLDTLLPDGSIKWSLLHRASYTPERSRNLSLSFAAQRRNDPPKVDPFGLRSFDRLLKFLKDRGVEVYLAHPPFNPIYWKAVQGSKYMAGLERIETLTRDLAKKYGYAVIGSFNPHKVGCTSDHYIDAEHSRPQCLGLIIDEFLKISKGTVGPAG